MRSVESSLVSGETVVWWGRLHWFPVASRFFWLAVSAGMGGALVWWREWIAREGFRLMGEPDPAAGVVAQAGLGIAAVAAAAFGLKAVGVLVWALGAVGREAAVTTRRVIFASGVLRRRAFEAALGEIASVSIRQGVLGRVLGYGVVEVSCGGRRRRMEMGGAVAFKREIERARAGLEGGRTAEARRAQRKA